MAAYVVYDTTPAVGDYRRVAGVYETQALADTAGAGEGLTAVTGAVNDSVDVGWWVVAATRVITAQPHPAADRRVAMMRQRLHDAWIARPRRDWWPSMRSGAEAGRPIIALDRWSYHLVAHGDVIAAGVWPSPALSLDDREDRVTHLVARLAAGETWYGVMVAQEAQPHGGNSALWAGASVADGAAIYNDSITAAGARRAMDGTFPAIPGATIPGGFHPDSPTLR